MGRCRTNNGEPTRKVSILRLLVPLSMQIGAAHMAYRFGLSFVHSIRGS